LCSKEVKTHELEINSIIKYKEQALLEIRKNHTIILDTEYKNILNIYMNLYEKRKAEGLNSADIISNFIGKKLDLKTYLI
jgi:hypothetical protein